MDFFNDLGKTINDMAVMAADKVGEFAENAKIKAEIASEKRELSQKYEAIGRRVYEQRKASLSEESDDPIDRFCLEVAEKEEKIRKMQEELKNNEDETGVKAEAEDAEIIDDKPSSEA